MRIRVLTTTAMIAAFTLVLSGVIHAGGGRKNKKKSDASIFDWVDEMSDAQEQAADEKKPIMFVVCASYGAEDYKAVEKMTSWPYAIVGSHRDFVATRETIKNDPSLKTLCEKFHVKSLPTIIWMDSYGNPVSFQSFPEAATQIQGVAQAWPALATKVDKFFKDHVDRGDRYVKMNHCHEAYNEYGLVAPFKGPLSDKAREAQAKLKDQWNKLLEMAKASAPRERGLILQGIQRETSGTDLEREMLVAVTETLNAVADKPAKSKTADSEKAETASKDANGSSEKPATGEAAKPPEEPKIAAVQPPAPVAKDPKAITPEKLLENKSLGDLASSSATLPAPAAEPDDGSVGAVLLTKSDPKLKEAHDMIQTAAASYRKAIADTTDRGAARNEMLKTAYQNLSKAMDILDAATATKPDAQLDKVSQDISMMMYGCLKYQSL